MWHRHLLSRHATERRPWDLVDATRPTGERGIRGIALWFSVVVCLACGPPVNIASANVPVQSWSDIAQQVIPSTVNVWVQRIYRSDKSDTAEQLKTFSGSGFVVDPSGEIVTNKHLMEGAFGITVTLSDGTELSAELVAAASLVDVAVLKVEAGRPLPPSSLPTAMRPGWATPYWPLAIRLG